MMAMRYSNYRCKIPSSHPARRLAEESVSERRLPIIADSLCGIYYQGNEISSRRRFPILNIDANNGDM